MDLENEYFISMYLPGLSRVNVEKIDI